MVFSETACSKPCIVLRKLIKSLNVPSMCLIDRNGKGEGRRCPDRRAIGKVHRVKGACGKWTRDCTPRSSMGLLKTIRSSLQPDPSVAEVELEVEEETVSSREQCYLRHRIVLNRFLAYTPRRIQSAVDSGRIEKGGHLVSRGMGDHGRKSMSRNPTRGEPPDARVARSACGCNWLRQIPANSIGASSRNVAAPGEEKRRHRSAGRPKTIWLTANLRLFW